MTNLIHYEIIDGHIALITLYRPKAANALSKQLLDELNETIERIDKNSDIFCTIITGSTDKVFCAGADLKERTGMTDEEVVHAVQYIGNTITNIENMAMPVIAAMNGVAYGGGLELALACDLRIASNDIQMGLTETSLAIIPGAGGTQRLPRLVGVGIAKELIYTAKRITAEEALAIHLVERVTQPDELMDEALQIARKIARNGPIALQQAKLAIDQGAQVDIASALTIEQLCYQKTIPTEDRLEGLKAFQEKRDPLYKGK